MARFRIALLATKFLSSLSMALFLLMPLYTEVPELTDYGTVPANAPVHEVPRLTYGTVQIALPFLGSPVARCLFRIALLYTVLSS